MDHNDSGATRETGVASSLNLAKGGGESLSSSSLMLNEKRNSHSLPN